MAAVKEVKFVFGLLFCILPCLCTGIGGFNPPQLTRSLKTEFICDEKKYELCTPSENASFPNLIHVTAIGPNDTLHYMISTIGVPTLLVARTSSNASVNVNLDHLMTGNFSQLGDDTITFDPEPFSVYSVLFTTVYEYNDVNDTADLGKLSNETEYWRFHHLAGLQWMASKNISDPKEHIIYLNVSSSRSFDNETDPFFFQDNGTFSLKFEFKTTNDRNDHLPHLEFNANSTQMSIVFDSLEPSFNKSRFALELALITDDPALPDNMELIKTRTIDDEFTPGVFEMVDWTSKVNQSTRGSGAYVQWKPICYKSLASSIQSVTKQFYYDLEPLSNSTLQEAGHGVSLAYAYFGSDLLANRYSMSTTNVSFGLTKDKFYADTHFSIWTMSIGYGIPPSDAVSLMIKLVIAIGLGVPVVLIIFGGIGVCVKKHKDKKAAAEDMTSSYSAIN